MNLRDLFENKLNSKLKERPELLNGFDGVIQIQVGEEFWHLNPESNENQIQSGEHKEPDCSISISNSDFEKLLSRSLNIPMAIAFRKIKIKGNPVYLSKLKDLLS